MIVQHARKADSPFSANPLAGAGPATVETAATPLEPAAPDPLPEAPVARQRLATGLPGAAIEARAVETVTVLRAHGRRLAKLVQPGGEVEDYDQAKLFDMAELPVPDLDALEGLLRELQARPDRAVVRGAVLDPTRTHGVRRLVHPCHKTGEPPTLRERARCWLALDVDGVPLPTGLDPRDLAGCGRHVQRKLPPAFHHARALVAASASHGIKPGARLRLWVWLTRPVGGGELRRWLRRAPVDPIIFRPAQLIFTAAPVFVSGVVDPLPVRLLALDGASEAVAVPSPAALTPLLPRPPSPLPAARTAGAEAYAIAALAREAARVGSRGQLPALHDGLRRAPPRPPGRSRLARCP